MQTAEMSNFHKQVVEAGRLMHQYRALLIKCGYGFMHDEVIIEADKLDLMHVVKEDTFPTIHTTSEGVAQLAERMRDTSEKLICGGDRV